MASNAQIRHSHGMGVASEPVWAVTPEKADAVVKRLVEVGRPRKIFLFGSYVRGQTHRDSDLDVLVVADDAIENTRKESARLRRAVEDIRMPLDIVVVRESVFDALKDKIGLIYREVVRHGRQVYDAGAAA
jgi:predicted nucleotidyltransferase